MIGIGFGAGGWSSGGGEGRLPMGVTVSGTAA
jgi:hypothetical protein